MKHVSAGRWRGLDKGAPTRATESTTGTTIRHSLLSVRVRLTTRTKTVNTLYATCPLAICEATPLISWSNQSPADATMKNKASWMVTERIKAALYCVRICMEAPMRLNVLQPKAYEGLEGGNRENK